VCGVPQATSANAAETASNCFGCAPGNTVGLRLVFTACGAGYSTRLRLGADYESFPGIIHGGIVATVLDETLAQAVYRSLGTAAFTSGLRVRYARPLRTGVEYTAYAEIIRSDDTSVRASGWIGQPDGDWAATADGTFFLLTDEVLGRPDQTLPAGLVDVLRASNSTAVQEK
jgi:uncharacterized protein (TIGR00369 family)